MYKSKQKEYLIHDTLPLAWNKLISEPDELLIELIADTTEKQCGYKPDNSTVEDFISNYIIKESTTTEKIRKVETEKKAISISGESYIGKSVSAFSNFVSSNFSIPFLLDFAASAKIDIHVNKKRKM